MAKFSFLIVGIHCFGFPVLIILLRQNQLQPQTSHQKRTVFDIFLKTQPLATRDLNNVDEQKVNDYFAGLWVRVTTCGLQVLICRSQVDACGSNTNICGSLGSLSSKQRPILNVLCRHMHMSFLLHIVSSGQCVHDGRGKRKNSKVSINDLYKSAKVYFRR